MINEINERIINRDYIGVVREIDGFLKYEEVEISQSDAFIEEIDSMKENNSYSLLDVQQRFLQEYPRESFSPDGVSFRALEGYYDYLYPQSYLDAYVTGAAYPIMSEDRYNEALKIKEELLRNQYISSPIVQNSLGLLKAKSEKDFEDALGKIESTIKEELDKYKNGLRRAFDFKPFVYAHNYKLTLGKIISQSDVRMYSTDQIGWKGFMYKINDDITVHINTNFGYGTSSYFFCNLKYKDINILPYSYTVDYYYVDMTDFIRCTRCYFPERASWDKVFDFTVLVANMAKHEPERFIREWIVNEVEDMMKGIRLDTSCSDKRFEYFLSAENKKAFFQKNEIAGYRFKNIIRNCVEWDRDEYKVDPVEKVFAYKVERITGCLLLLDNLQKLTEIAPVIIPYIAEIEQMNIILQPELEMHMNKISADIKQLSSSLDDIIKKLAPLESLLDSHQMQIEKMRKEMNDKKAEEIYEEVIILKDKIKNIMKEKEKLKTDKRLREKFLEILTKCKNRIDKYIKAA